jgi:hypothetical protein
MLSCLRILPETKLSAPLRFGSTSGLSFPFLFALLVFALYCRSIAISPVFLSRSMVSIGCHVVNQATSSMRNEYPMQPAEVAHRSKAHVRQVATQAEGAISDVSGKPYFQKKNLSTAKEYARK